ncbi:hypothetical protein [Paenibacillus sp. HB172176]|uniref:hypothetical protein n=1 Tax=Paenibacillus sp. HB172176 TaxID=2493690 RepID=UPI00143BB69B|nr:hypothetical protein [Paenibacillus sp. HB172176]
MESTASRDYLKALVRDTKQLLELRDGYFTDGALLAILAYRSEKSFSYSQYFAS